MLSGRRLDLLNPAPIDIEMSDIAHGLSFVARWNGQTTGSYPYSVAEHSLLVEQLMRKLFSRCPASLQLSALLHDAAEYVIGDMISPVKNAVGPGYEQLELHLTSAIRRRFGLKSTLPEAQARKIKRADLMSAWIEATGIAGFDTQEADKLFLRPPMDIADQFNVEPRPPEIVREAFIKRANELSQQIS